MSATPRLRFAPSPTGYLHVGSARAALFNWLVARQTGGAFLLRVEDTDRERNRPELTENILDSMRWLGLDWDDDVVYQADNLDQHAAAARSLLDAGKAYWCDCTPEDVDARRTEKGASGYDGFCRDRSLAEGAGAALRFRSPDDGTTDFTDVIRGPVTFDNSTIEDFVLLRSNGLPVFLLSNAMDDATMAITHVVRGEDHVNGTPKYLLLRDALDLGRPDVIAHLPLLVNESRKKLSKRRDSVAVGEFKDRGYLPEAMMNYLALLGWGPKDDVEIRPMSEITALFRLEDVNPAPAFFDEKKLEHFNAEYVRALTVDEFVERTTPFLTQPDATLGPIRALAPALQQRVRLLPDAEPMVDFLHLDRPVRDEASWEKVMAKTPEVAGAMLASAIDAFATVEWDAESLHASLLALGEAQGLKLGKAQAPIRVAVTGRTVGPPLFESLEVLGRDATIERMRVALADLA
ncbi:glutamate--tRNA ligase [Actinospongicola halichondriae]|uniref:glutamate--tRNA ligase n=1 Tax=Actinospongicola halichondriae TaxID=3236844 RepID=UPI003D50DD2A